MVLLVFRNGSQRLRIGLPLPLDHVARRQDSSGKLLRRSGSRVLARAAFLLVGLVEPASASEEAWQALREGGVVALIRHARAPGTGDPAGFKLEDCSTQRNLSEEGRDEARRLGAKFEAERVKVVRVLSSRWCRALDTARLAFGPKVEPEPALNSAFADPAARDPRTDAVRRLIAEWRSQPDVLVLVTHQVNMTALTGSFAGEGEVLVLAPTEAGFNLAGRVRVQ